VKNICLIVLLSTFIPSYLESMHRTYEREELQEDVLCLEQILRKRKMENSQLHAKILKNLNDTKKLKNTTKTSFSSRAALATGSTFAGCSCLFVGGVAISAATTFVLAGWFIIEMFKAKY